MTWKNDALILQVVLEKELLNFSKNKDLTTFSINLALAEKFGLIELTTSWKAGVCGRSPRSE